MKRGWMILVGLWLGWAVAQTPAPTPAPMNDKDLTVDGAVRLATQFLAQDNQSPVGRALVELALALEPEQREALSLRAACTDRLTVEAPAEVVADNGVTFSQFLVKLAEPWTASPTRKTLVRGQLFFGVAGLLAPQNEKASTYLDKVRRQGVDTSLEGLLAAYQREAAPAAAPAAAAGPKAGTLAAKLAAIPVANLDIANRQPIRAINTLNFLLRKEGIAIVPKSSKLNITFQETREGMPYYFANQVDLPGEYRVYSIRDGNAMQAIRTLARASQLSYQLADNQVLITDPGEGQAQYLTATASGMAEEFKASIAKSLGKYNNQTVEVTGSFDGFVSGSLGRPTIALNDDKMRLVFASGSDKQGPLAELKRVYDQEKERVSSARKHDREMSRYWGFSDDWNPYGAKVINIEVTVVGKCTGYRGGRIMVEDCEDLMWRRR